ncbi:Halomucin [Frankliniella fusca]|uniref:Halomucin n=1 Tax=Frankliniella fusca TaxID=407009 RepID=A0AAE1HES0_9NEOP|nr:Halomucin [Frankliniella fusca]
MHASIRVVNGSDQSNVSGTSTDCSSVDAKPKVNTANLSKDLNALQNLNADGSSPSGESDSQEKTPVVKPSGEQVELIDENACDLRPSSSSRDLSKTSPSRSRSRSSSRTSRSSSTTSSSSSSSSSSGCSTSSSSSSDVRSKSKKRKSKKRKKSKKSKKSKSKKSKREKSRTKKFESDDSEGEKERGKAEDTNSDSDHHISKKKKKKHKRSKPRKVTRNLEIYLGKMYNHSETSDNVVKVHGDYDVYIPKKQFESITKEAKSLPLLIRDLVRAVFTKEALKGSTAQGYPNRIIGRKKLRQKDVLPRLDPDGREAILLVAKDIQESKKSWRPRKDMERMSQAFTQAVKRLGEC